MADTPGVALLRHLGVAVPAAAAAAAKTERDFEVPGLDLRGDGDGRFVVTAGGRRWTLETKVALADADLRKLAHLVARLAPPGSVASLQADGHNAGNVFVGLVLSYAEERVPVNLVSGDIGCGLTLVPVARRGVQLRRTDVADPTEYHSWALACMRRALKRGKLAEKGLSNTAYLDEAVAFYGAELAPWLRTMGEVLAAVGLGPGPADPQEVLAYVGRFAQSLGSSGNHFMELAADDEGGYWMVVHSGSRALGAMVYAAVAEACRLTADGFEVATGELARFYARAYDALNQFAKLNRVVCAVAALDAMGADTSAATLKAVMVATPLFAPCSTVATPLFAPCSTVATPLFAPCSTAAPCAAVALLGGLTHNGLKAFVNDERREVMHVLSKGAIALSRRASAAIVALRAGEGCVAFTLVDPACPWREATLREAQEARALGYAPVLLSTEAEAGIVLAGHGAGRAQSTSETSRTSTFAGIAAYYRRHDVVGNLAPGVLGDNPEVAYKPSAEVTKHLPLGIARTVARLRTCVSHKEGMTYKKAERAACAAHIRAAVDSDPMAPLWCDFNLVQDLLTPEEYADGCARRDALFAALDAKYRET